MSPGFGTGESSIWTLLRDGASYLRFLPSRYDSAKRRRSGTPSRDQGASSCRPESTSSPAWCRASWRSLGRWRLRLRLSRKWRTTDPSSIHGASRYPVFREISDGAMLGWGAYRREEPPGPITLSLTKSRFTAPFVIPHRSDDCAAVDRGRRPRHPRPHGVDVVSIALQISVKKILEFLARIVSPLSRSR